MVFCSKLRLLTIFFSSSWLKVISFLFFSFSLFSQFQPSNLPNLKLWLKSENVILNGTKVSQWTDLSGNNNHIIQNDANKQPLLMQYVEWLPYC